MYDAENYKLVTASVTKSRSTTKTMTAEGPSHQNVPPPAHFRFCSLRSKKKKMLIVFLIEIVASLPPVLQLLPEHERPQFYTTDSEFEQPNFREPGYRLQCYECQNVKSEEECDQNIVTCADNALSCQARFSLYKDQFCLEIAKT